jgi:hypothetical protein
VDSFAQPLGLLRAKPGERLDELTPLSGDHLHDQTDASHPARLREDL